MHWLTEIIVIVSIVLGGFLWHRYDVHSSVESARSAWVKEQAAEVKRIEDQAKFATKELQDKVKEIENAKSKDKAAADLKYANLLSWVQHLPSSSPEVSPGNPYHQQGRPEDVIGELRRSDAERLADYSRTTETLRINLQACYQQYDDVKTTIDTFRSSNSGSK